MSGNASRDSFSHVQTTGQCLNVTSTLWLLILCLEAQAIVQFTSAQNKTGRGRGSLIVGLSAGLVIERLRVRTPAGAAGEFSSLELFSVRARTRCPFHPRVIAVARKRLRSFREKCRWQDTPKHAYTPDSPKSVGADYAIQASYE